MRITADRGEFVLARGGVAVAWASGWLAGHGGFVVAIGLAVFHF